jgi:hypothetical protein
MQETPDVVIFITSYKIASRFYTTSRPIPMSLPSRTRLRGKRDLKKEIPIISSY